ncbi:MAG: hypothetical protein HY722_04695 [Planctomycetes bacterium]|nr:hypothetical protein [Planctomycetota bacterium]
MGDGPAPVAPPGGDAATGEPPRGPRPDPGPAHALRVSLEVVAATALVLGTGVLLEPERPGWVELKLHPLWLVVLPAALRYGSGAGAFAGALAGVALLVLRFRAEGWPAYWEDLLDWRTMDLPAALFGVGWFVGEAMDRARATRRDVEDRLELARREADRLDFKARQLEEANRSLRERVARQLSPAAMLYQVSRRMEGLDEGALQGAALDLLVELIQATRCSYYALDEGRLLCRARRGWGADLQTAGVLPLAGSVAGTALRERRLVSLREQAHWDDQGRATPGQDILLAAPVLGAGEAARSVLTVEAIPFLQLTQATESVLRMVADWTGMALARLDRHARLQERAIVDEELEVLTEAYFRDSLDRQFHHARRTGEGFAVVQVKLRDFPFWPEERQLLVWKAVAHILNRSLAATDLICRHPIRGFLWVLSPRKNTSLEGLEARIRGSIDAYFVEAHEGAVRLDLASREGPGGFADARALLGSFDELAHFLDQATPAAASAAPSPVPAPAPPAPAAASAAVAQGPA